MARVSLAAIAVVVAAATGCGSSTPAVHLEGGTDAADGKAIVLSASTDAKLASQQGGVHGLELRGIDADSGDASFDEPDYVDKTRCALSPCEWTVVPAKAATYEFKAFLVDVVKESGDVGESNSVKVDWAAPPRPEAIKLFVNGKAPPTAPLDGDLYTKFPAGPLRVEAKWAGDARGTGYYVKISQGAKAYARCSTGTSCRVPGTVPLGTKDLMEWKVELLTTKGDRLAGGFRVCLEAAAA
jgi:hypothetical protein